MTIIQQLPFQKRAIERELPIQDQIRAQNAAV